MFFKAGVQRNRKKKKIAEKTSLERRPEAYVIPALAVLAAASAGFVAFRRYKDRNKARRNPKNKKPERPAGQCETQACSMEAYCQKGKKCILVAIGTETDKSVTVYVEFDKNCVFEEIDGDTDAEETLERIARRSFEFVRKQGMRLKEILLRNRGLEQ